MMKRNMDNDNVEIGGKRSCIDKVSRVLHIRNVSSDVSERDIANLAIPFGPITYFVLTRKTGQALMEMQHEESARAMIDYYNECPPQLFNKIMVVQFSRYETLSGSGMHYDAEVAVKAVNEDIKKLCQEEPHLVLHLTIESWEGPKLGHLHFFKLLHRFGNILRIIVFIQNQSPQALVEFENEISAHVAKLQLSTGTTFYGRPMHIKFSTRKTLDIKHESDTGRDYTISPVLNEELSNIPISNQLTSNFNQPQSNFNQSQSNFNQPQSNFNQSQSNYNQSQSNFNQSQSNFNQPQSNFNQPQSNFNQSFSNFNQPFSNFNQSLSNFNQYSSDSSERRNDFSIMPRNNVIFTAAEALELLQPLLQAANSNPCDAFPLLQNIAPTLSNILAQGQGNSNPRAFDNGRTSVNRQTEKSSKSPVLLVTNLNEDRVTPDALFILFGAYGDIIRIKILYNKKNSALIQFVDADNSERAISHLNNMPMFGKQLKISYSKHTSISMPKTDEQGSSNLNKEYTNSRLHRFKKTTARTMQNLYSPGVVLHIAGVPDNFTESDMRRILEEEGYRPVKVKIISPNQRKMALVQLDTVDRAVEALIRLHDIEIGLSRLRVSFSKGFIAN